MPFVIIGLIGLLIFAGLMIEKQISDRLLNTSHQLEAKAAKVAVYLEERLARVYESVQFMSLHLLLQNGSSEVIEDFLTAIMELPLIEAMLVIDYDGSLMAEVPSGWYAHYLRYSSDLELSRSNSLLLDRTPSMQEELFVKVVPVEHAELEGQTRLIVIFANLQDMAGVILLGCDNERIALFTDDGREMVLADSIYWPEQQPFSKITNLLGYLFRDKAALYLQGRAVIAQQGWVVTVSKSFGAFLAENISKTLFGFRFLSLLFFPIFIVLLQMLLEFHNSRRHFQMLASQDSLTGLFNHRSFQSKLCTLINSKDDAKVSLLMLDLDNFKSFNDTYGHQAGDEVLKEVSKILLRNTRPTDVVARYGGEEFVVILPGVDLEETLKAAERIREAIKAECECTASIGVSSFPAFAASAEQLIHGADLALYKAKNMSKDTVESVENMVGLISEVPLKEETT